MPDYDCTYIPTNAYDTDPVPDAQDLTVRAYLHMDAKAKEGWRLVSTATPPEANAVVFFWERVV